MATHPSPPHTLPTVTESTTSESEEEDGERVAGTHTSAATETEHHTADHHTLVNERPKESVSVPDQQSWNADTLASDSDQNSTTCSDQNTSTPKSSSSKLQLQSRPPSHQGNERLEEVRREVLSSLYQRYLKELQASRPNPPKKSLAVKRGVKPGKKVCEDVL